MNTEHINILVAVAAYPDNEGSILMNYAHTRNTFYLSKGLDVTVLNFSAKKDYTIDNIKVITLKSYTESPIQYSLLICHAPNLRNHYLFIRKNGNKFQRIIFFFHGHEVLRINKAYCKPYPYMKKNIIHIFLQNRYDDIKLAVWRSFIKNAKNKLTLVFVSNWMLEQFEKWTKIRYDEISNRSFITYNCIGDVFEKAVYEKEGNKKYDFITIRNNLDGSKYCVDIVNKIALHNPNLKFLVVGMGSFFSHYKKADNLEWLNKTMNHKEIFEKLQLARCALMPTRTDAQGLMMCEMASTGIPVITSDIDVCHEVFAEFENVEYISNERVPDDIGDILNRLEVKEPYQKNRKYYNRNTSQKEVEIILQLCSKL